MNKNLGQISYLTLIILLLTSLGAYLSNIGETFEQHAGLSNMFRWRGPIQVEHNAVIVTMNSDSAKALSLPRDIEFWPPKLHIDLINTMNHLGIKGIVFDIPLSKVQKQADDTQHLFNVLSSSDHTLFVTKATDHSSNDLSLTHQLNEPQAIAQHVLASAEFFLPDDKVIQFMHLFPEENQYSSQVANFPIVSLQAFTQYAQNAWHQSLNVIEAQNVIEDLKNSPHLLESIQIQSRFLQQLPLGEFERLISAIKSQPEQFQKPLLALAHSYRLTEPVHINFYGGANHFPSIPYHKILNFDQLNEDEQKGIQNQLKNKMVFLGATEPGSLNSHDLHYTIYSTSQGADMSNLELQATMFSNLFEGHVLKSTPIWMDLSIIISLSLLLFLSSRFISFIPWLLFATSTVLIYVSIAFVLFRDSFLLLPVSIPLFILLPSTIIAVLWRLYRRNLKAHQSTKKTLEQYIPTHIAEEMSNKVSRLNQQRQLVQSVCLLTDIRGFTTFAEFCPPDRLHCIMNDYYRIVSRIVRKNQGTVINIVGDGLLAIWSGPKISDEMCYKASYAALQIINETDKYNSQLFDGPNTILRNAATNIATCIGLHGGELSIGNLGSTSHFEYAPVGDTVNTTSRIEAYTRQLNSRILISDVVHQHIKDFRTKSHGKIALKGKSKSVEIYELIGLKN